MDKILIAGIDTVVGANLAANLCEQYHVIGLAFRTPIAIANCEISFCGVQSVDSTRQWLASVRPESMIYCGPAARSSWENSASTFSGQDVEAAANWANAAREFHCPLTCISSDAVFTGPWMFHTEQSTCYCTSVPALTVRSIERTVAEKYPSALIIRTNAYGWSPETAGGGWIEQLVASLESGSCGGLDCLRHATPILASDLGPIIEQAQREKLTGLIHVAGAERTNPVRFAECLAEIFELRKPIVRAVSAPDSRTHAYGAGETSLQSPRVRKTLKLGLPMLSEGLKRLREQQANGYCERLKMAPEPVHDRVA